MIHFRSATLTDLIRSAPSLPLWKCFGYFLLVALGIELLVGVFTVPPHIVHFTDCSQCALLGSQLTFAAPRW